MKEMHGMRAVRSFVVAVVATVVLGLPAEVLADGRVALVVGNSTYAHIGRLPNPENDATDISSALRRLGFEVTTEFDADRVELTAALRAFTESPETGVGRGSPQFEVLSSEKDPAFAASSAPRARARQARATSSRRVGS